MRYPHRWFALGVGCLVSCLAPRGQQIPEVAPAPERDTGRIQSKDAAAPDLFALARELSTGDNKNAAISVYENLLARFPNSSEALPARFNLALLYEGLKNFAKARDLYRYWSSSVVPTRPSADAIWLHAQFRLAVVYGKLQDWWHAVAVFDRILEVPWLDDEDRVEAFAGRGISLHEAGSVDEAEAALMRVLRFSREAYGVGSIAERGFAAEAALRLGEIVKSRYDAVQLSFPVEQLRKQLETKCILLLKAQGRYVRAIEHGDTHTAAIAGLRIGSLYESLHHMIVTLETPRDLNAEEAIVYQEEVAKRVEVLLRKALRVYERALSLGRSAPSAQHWVIELENSVQRLRRLYLGVYNRSGDAVARQG